MFSTFDLCLLLYVIRLAGWLKHCNLSLSLSNLSLSLSQQTGHYIHITKKTGSNAKSISEIVHTRKCEQTCKYYAATTVPDHVLAK